MSRVRDYENPFSEDNTIEELHARISQLEDELYDAKIRNVQLKNFIDTRCHKNTGTRTAALRGRLMADHRLGYGSKRRKRNRKRRSRKRRSRKGR